MPFGENIPDQNHELSYTENFQLEHGPKSAGPKANFVNSLSSPSRRPLQNISNGPCKNQEPKPSTTKWKKLARAHKPISGPPTIVQPLKRDFMLIEEDLVQGKRPKAGLDQCNFGTTFTIDNTLDCLTTKITAEAGSQPCRKP